MDRHQGVGSGLKNECVQSRDQVGKNSKVIKRGLVVSDMMPIDEWTQILSAVLPLSIPPMRSDCANLVQLRVSSARERSISLSIELPLKGLNTRLPVLGLWNFFYFDNKDSSKGERGRRQFHYLDNGNMAF